MMHLNIKQQLHSKKVKGTSNIVHAVNLMLQTGRAQTVTGKIMRQQGWLETDLSW